MVKHIRRAVVPMAFVALAMVLPAIGQAAETKTIGDRWTWFTDYAYLYSEWTLNCEVNRQCEVGTGISVSGTPRGSKQRFTGHIKVTTYGIGAVHARCVDGNGPCTVRLDQGDVGAITVYRQEFP